MRVFKTVPEATLPSYGTANSACFDIAACIEGRRFDSGSVCIEPGCLLKVPTGLIFEIPEDYYMRVYIRSSVACRGLVLVNGTPIIDHDYRNELILPILNVESIPMWISNGDRLAQGEIVPMSHVTIEEMFEAPEKVSSRTGGFGSTGV